MVVLNEKGCPSLIYFKTWSVAGEPLHDDLGEVALLEEVCHHR